MATKLEKAADEVVFCMDEPLTIGEIASLVSDEIPYEDWVRMFTMDFLQEEDIRKRIAEVSRNMMGKKTGVYYDVHDLLCRVGAPAQLKDPVKFHDLKERVYDFRFVISGQGKTEEEKRRVLSSSNPLYFPMATIHKYPDALMAYRDWNSDQQKALAVNQVTVRMLYEFVTNKPMD